MKTWRIAVGELAQETDSFSPLVAGLDEFESYGLFRGDELLVRMRGAGPLGGLFEVAEQQGRQVEWKPLVRAWAGAGGPIQDPVFAELLDDLLRRLRDAGPVDAVFLSLHGAAATETNDDVEGTVLAAVRQIVGPDVPIVVPLDHHANVTSRMIDNVDLLVAHETQPHDPIDTGRKVARLLFRWLDGEIRPSIAWRKIPLITPQDQFLTVAGPMKEWFDRARHWERTPGVLDVSPCPMQPWLDAAEGGWSVVVHTDGDEALADRVAADMAELAWKLRDEFWRSERLAPADAVACAVRTERGLAILSDTGDSVYGGAPGDNTTLLRELLLAAPTVTCLVPVVDPIAVAVAHTAGVGAPITLDVGGRNDRMFCEPVSVTGRVGAISEGVTVDIVDRGVCRIGRSALVECGGVKIVLLEERTFAINHPTLYWHLGIDVHEARVVVVKTASNFQFFAPWRTALFRADTPGTTQSNLRAFPWRRLPRPIAGLDS